MQAIIKRKLAFRNPKGGKMLIIDPSPSPQEIPEWVRSTDEFETVQMDDCFQEVVLKKVSRTEAVAVPKSNKTDLGLGSDEENSDEDKTKKDHEEDDKKK